MSIEIEAMFADAPLAVTIVRDVVMEVPLPGQPKRRSTPTKEDADSLRIRDVAYEAQQQQLMCWSYRS